VIRFKSLGSGSSGNATIVEGRSGTQVRRLLIDCGLGPRQLAARLGESGLAIDDIDAIFITHEHSDHVGCMQKIALRHRIPAWMSHGTYSAIGAPDLDGLLHVAADGQAIDLGAFEARAFTVPHDAREPLHLRCSDGATHVGLLTDLGHATEHVLSHLRGCHALLLETNHDREMLSVSSYPAFLKRRIGGAYGHLGNHVSAEILRAVHHGGLKRVAAAHLSLQNNRPDLARAALAQAIGWAPEQIDVADPRTGTGWIAAD